MSTTMPTGHELVVFQSNAANVPYVGNSISYNYSPEIPDAERAAIVFYGWDASHQRCLKIRVPLADVRQALKGHQGTFHASGELVEDNA